MKSWWKIGRLAPAIMVAVAAINFALCFKSLDWLAFRCWEAVVGVEKPTGVGPFEPNTVIVKDHAYGDLASIGNMKDMRLYRHEEFRVDQFGFRNNLTGAPSDSGGFVVGDSFVAGASVSDWDTLPAQLTRASSKYFFNAGGKKASLANAEAAASIMRLPAGTVVYELLERNAVHYPPSISDLRLNYDAPDHRAHSLAERFAENRILKAAKLLASDQSPGVILSRKLEKSLANDVWVANQYGKEVVRRRLENGDEMLFFPDDFKDAENIEEVCASWRDYLALFSERLAERNLSMVVLLVPNKGTVYGSFTSPAPRDFQGGRLLQRLESELRAANIPALDVTPVLQTLAAQELPRHKYLYWRDDTHWNADGIKVVADALWSEMQAGRLHEGTEDKRVAERLVPHDILSK